MGFTSEDRIRANQQALPAERSSHMRDPNYIRDHPSAGIAGTQRIYRYDNNRGATVDWLFAKPGWTLTPILFYGMEITSFHPNGEPEPNLDETKVHARLDEIAGGVLPKPAAEETPLERHHRLIAEAQSSK